MPLPEIPEMLGMLPRARRPDFTMPMTGSPGYLNPGVPELQHLQSTIPPQRAIDSVNGEATSGRGFRVMWDGKDKFYVWPMQGGNHAMLLDAEGISQLIGHPMTIDELAQMRRGIIVDNADNSGHEFIADGGTRFPYPRTE